MQMAEINPFKAKWPTEGRQADIPPGDKLDKNMSNIILEEVIEAVKEIKNWKSSGPDDISPKALKSNPPWDANDLVQ